jgi:hypothetical protein
VRKALEQAGRVDLMGGGCDALIHPSKRSLLGASKPSERFEATTSAENNGAAKGPAIEPNAMCDHFCLKSCSDDTLLTFSGTIPRGLTGYHGTNFRVTLESMSIRAALDVYDIQPHCWSEFFADLAANWMGWEGTRQMTSLEGELRIACTTERGGHVNVRVFLRCNRGPDDWRVEQTIHPEAGQLEPIARQARQYFGWSVP